MYGFRCVVMSRTPTAHGEKLCYNPVINLTPPYPSNPISSHHLKHLKHFIIYVLFTIFLKNKLLSRQTALYRQNVLGQNKKNSNNSNTIMDKILAISVTVVITNNNKSDNNFRYHRHYHPSITVVQQLTAKLLFTITYKLLKNWD